MGWRGEGEGQSERGREKKLKRRQEIRSQRNGRNQEDLVGENLDGVAGLWGLYSDAGSQDRSE